MREKFLREAQYSREDEVERERRERRERREKNLTEEEAENEKAKIRKVYPLFFSLSFICFLAVANVCAKMAHCTSQWRT